MLNKAIRSEYFCICSAQRGWQHIKSQHEASKTRHKVKEVLQEDRNKHALQTRI